MEKMVEIEVIQPRLGEYLKQVENGEVIIVTSASEPKGVIMGYDMYNEMKAIAQKNKAIRTYADCKFL